MQSAWNRGALNPFVCKVLVGVVGAGLLLIALFHQPWIPVEIRQPETGVLAAMPAPSWIEVRDSNDLELAKIEPSADVATSNRLAGDLKASLPSPPLKQTAAVPAEISPNASWLELAHRDHEERAPESQPLGRPTVEYRLPAPFQIPISEAGAVWSFAIPTGVRQELFLQGVELRPGNTSLVKRMILSYDLTGDARRKDQQTAEPGFPSSGGVQVPAEVILAEWAKDQASPSPMGSPQRIPAGADLVLTVEYTATPIAANDPWSMRLYLARSNDQ